MEWGTPFTFGGIRLTAHRVFRIVGMGVKDGVGEEYDSNSRSPRSSFSPRASSSSPSSISCHVGERISEEKSSVGLACGFRDTTSTRRSPAAAIKGTVRQQSKSWVRVSFTWK